MNASALLSLTKTSSDNHVQRYFDKIVSELRAAAERGETSLHIRYERLFPKEISVPEEVYENAVADKLRALGYTVYLIPDSYYTLGGMRVAWGPLANKAFRSDRFAYEFFGKGTLGF